MGRDSVTGSGRGMKPDAPSQTGVPAARRHWVEGGRIHRRGRRDRRRVDPPCDGSAFFASLRFIWSDCSTEENRGYQSGEAQFLPAAPIRVIRALRGQDCGSGLGQRVTPRHRPGLGKGLASTDPRIHGPHPSSQRGSVDSWMPLPVLVRPERPRLPHCAMAVTSRPTSAASAMLWPNTARRIFPSWPWTRVATPATTMLCASIILPMTPPTLFAAHMR